MVNDKKNTISTAKISHGGARAGAGRPKGSGKYKEPTKAIRVPEGSISQIKDFLQHYPEVMQLGSAVSLNSAEGSSLSSAEGSGLPDEGSRKLKIPLYSSSVAAGIPSPAEDHIEDTLDLNDYMVQRPDSTFMLRVEGESMRDVGILPNDILVVDRSIKATHKKIVIAAIDGELTVKRLFHRAGLIKLMAENPAYQDIELEQESDLVIWGVVVGSFRRFQTF